MVGVMAHQIMCDVCHTAPARLWSVQWASLLCSDECSETLWHRACAYTYHRATRTNTWPTTDEWRRFAAAVADWHFAEMHGAIKKDWAIVAKGHFLDFAEGYLMGTTQSATMRLGAEYRRLQEERQR